MNVRASGEIARHVRNKISALGYTNTDDKTRPEALYSLKDRLRYGPSDIQILGVNRFQVSLRGDYFNQAVRRELYDGVVRIKQLEKSVQALSTGNAATAWLLTTCYYASFFAAIEILRCSGSFVSYFHSPAINQIKQQATSVVAANIEEGTYEGAAEYDASTGQVTITFVKKHIRHHELTWQQMKRIITQTKKALTGIDAIHQEHLERFIGRDAAPSWPSPSDVRNHWNYEDASLFGKNGEVEGAEFRKLAKNKGSAVNWGGQKKVASSHSSEACSIAFIMNALICAMEELSSALLPESLSKLLPRA
jgi:hypothetical protein